MDLLVEHLGKGFINTLIITMPIILTAAGIGLVIGILQAVTQVQEQTISTAPKVLGVFLVIMLLGGFFNKLLTEYILDSADLAFNVLPKQDNYLLPSEYQGDDQDKKYRGGKNPNIDDLMHTPGKVPISDNKVKKTTFNTQPQVISKPNLAEMSRIYKAR